jgi:transcriptional regulator with XRE-family HTH domain
LLVNFKTALAARKMSQADLAQALQIAPTVLSEIIHERRRADVSLKAKLARALNVDERWLFLAFVRLPAPSLPEIAVAMLAVGREP